METPIRNSIPECPFAAIEKFEIYLGYVCTSPKRVMGPGWVDLSEYQGFLGYCCSKSKHPFCKYYLGKEETARPESDER